MGVDDLWKFCIPGVKAKPQQPFSSANVVQEIRKKARDYDPNNLYGAYDSFHVRRGDFQCKKLKYQHKNYMIHQKIK